VPPGKDHDHEFIVPVELSEKSTELPTLKLVAEDRKSALTATSSSVPIVTVGSLQVYLPTARKST